MPLTEWGTKNKSVVKKVDHTYRDYSNTTFPGNTALRDECFPSILYSMLSVEEYAHIIKWQSHGRAWIIVDIPKLTALLPLHFDHANYASFNRSVNDWGFKVCVVCVSELTC